VKTGNKADAVARLESVTAMPGLASKQYLEAWSALRLLGVMPPAESAKRVYGVVVEVTLDTGPEAVAAYSDRTARYMNSSGAAVIWEAPDHRLDADIQSLLDAGAKVAEIAGIWRAEGRPPPAASQARVDVLTPGGVRFGEGPTDELSRDPVAGSVVGAATKLMVGLTSLGTHTGP
jgi:hypothetical protein